MIEVKEMTMRDEIDCPSISVCTFAIGDKVQKIKGYRWPGVVVAVFKTLKGETRLVVECTVPEVAGALHIYSPEQLDFQRKSCP